MAADALEVVVLARTVNVWILLVLLLSVAPWRQSRRRADNWRPMAKRVRGDVARAVLSAPEPPETPEDVAALTRAAGMRVELVAGSSLDVIE